MSKVCGDCLYCKMDYGNWKCAQKRKSVQISDRACDKFVSDSHHTCIDCYYCEYITGGLFTKDDDCRCTRTNKKVKDSTLSCSHFVPS